MAITFRNLPKGSTIGSGTYVFRHYGDEVLDYLCFTAEQANSTISMSVTGTPSKNQAFETSTDGLNWSVFTPSATAITLANIGDKVFFRGDNTTVSQSSSIYYNFVMSGKISASGNIMSLLDKTCKSVKISNTYCFYNMFYGCTSLTTPPSLPATALANDCYERMFYGCKNLTTAPELPATTLRTYCYSSMFYGCTSLTVAPSLPATTLQTACYSHMFGSCTSLTTAPPLPATMSASYCYNSMFYKCTSITIAPEISSTTASSYSFQSMFEDCISLITAPTLRSRSASTYCYECMFYGCKNLTTVPALPATGLSSNCYRRMFKNCTSLQVYSSSSTGHTKEWRIPKIGTASSYTTQTEMFYSCPGSYTTSTSVSLNTTFYTQNTPV